MARNETPRNASEYEQFAAEWQRRRKDGDRGAANWLLEPAGLPVDATALMQTLRVLGEITQDPTFAAARVALAGHGLVDADGKWKRHAILASELARDVLRGHRGRHRRRGAGAAGLCGSRRHIERQGGQL